MDSLLGTLVLVLPGIVAFYLYQMIGPAMSRQITDYEKTLIGLMFNIPGVLLSWGLISLYWHQKVTFVMFQQDIMRMPCFLFYLALVFLCAFGLASWWDETGRKSLEKWINSQRDGNRPLVSSETPWEQFVGKEKEAILRIYPLDQKDKAVLGIFKASWMPGDQEKGILLKMTHHLKKYDKCFKKPLRTYVDTATKMVYEIFPPDAYDNAIRREKEAIEHQNQSSS